MGGALPQDWLGINRWVVTNWAVHRLSFFGFINIFYFPTNWIIIITIIMIILFPLSKCFHFNPRVFSLLFFQFSHPSHSGVGWGGVGENWASGCVRLSCQLGLNHDKYITLLERILPSDCECWRTLKEVRTIFSHSYIKIAI